MPTFSLLQAPELEKLANEICAGSLHDTSTEAHDMTVCMTFLLLTTSRAVGSESVSGQMISGGHPTVLPIPVIAEVAISDRNVARLCVRQDLGHFCLSSQAVSDALLTCVSTAAASGKKQCYIRLLSCGCIFAIVQKSMPTVGDYCTLVQALPLNTERQISVIGQGT